MNFQIVMKFTQVYPDYNILVFLFELQNRPWPAGFPFSTVRDQKDNNHS